MTDSEMRTMLLIDDLRRKVTLDLEWALSLLNEMNFTCDNNAAERYLTVRRHLNESKRYTESCEKGN